MNEDVNNNIPEEEGLDNIIVLNDENGEEYVVLLPVEESDDAGEVVILKLEDTDSEEEESYVSVDDEETLNKVFEIFKEKFKDDFNFVD